MNATPVGHVVMAVPRSIASTSARNRGRASSMMFSSTILLLAMWHAGCGGLRGTAEERLDRRWKSVQEQFDRLSAFELEFRVAAAAAAGESDADKLQFVRSALDRRSQLQLGLKRELRRFTAASASEPQSARLPYVTRLRLEMEKLKAVMAASEPSVKALALERYEAELAAYQAQKDAELRDGR